MKHPVALISDQGMDGWWGSTILNRSDLEVHWEASYRFALQAVIKTGAELVVAEEWPGAMDYQTFLSDLLVGVRRDNFHIVLITNSLAPSLARPPIAAVLPYPATPESLEGAVIAALNLIPRAGKRHLVRLHLTATSSEASNLGMVTTLQLNEGGMLVESPKILPLTRLLFWSFQGVRELQGLRYPGTVLREVPGETPSRMRHYAVRFEEAETSRYDVLRAYLQGLT